MNKQGDELGDDQPATGNPVPPRDGSWGWNPAQSPPTFAPPPVAPPPVAPPPGPSTPRAKPRMRWLVVLVSVLALVLVIGIVGTVLFFTRTYPPLAAAYDFTDDLHDGRTDDAFAQTCDRSRTSNARPSFDRFARPIARAESVSVDLFSVDRTGDSATVEFHTTSDDGDRQTDYTLRLVNEDGDWRPCATV